MSKYDPLTAFLSDKGGREVRMTFAEIENVIGAKLPAKSKTIRAWWSNNPSNNVLTKAWLAAGYKSARVDVAGENISFVPNVANPGFGEMKQSPFKPQVSEPSADKATDSQKIVARHPLFGVWKGLVTLVPGYDYTKPAYDEWKELYGDEE